MNTESKNVRAFVAIRLPEPLLATLAGMQCELRSLMPLASVAWTKPESMHLTLRFLGTVATPRIPELENQLRAALAGFGKLELVCERLGCFPGLRHPRVVWAGVHDPAGRLQQLHGCIDEAAREFAEKPAEARFVGHITLARLKGIKRADAEQLARFVETAVNRTFGSWLAHEVLLLQSELSPVGSKYHELARIGLG